MINVPTFTVASTQLRQRQTRPPSKREEMWQLYPGGCYYLVHHRHGHLYEFASDSVDGLLRLGLDIWGDVPGWSVTHTTWEASRG